MKADQAIKKGFHMHLTDKEWELINEQFPDEKERDLHINQLIEKKLSFEIKHSSTPAKTVFKSKTRKARKAQRLARKKGRK